MQKFDVSDLPKARPEEWPDVSFVWNYMVKFDLGQKSWNLSGTKSNEQMPKPMLEM